MEKKELSEIAVSTYLFSAAPIIENIPKKYFAKGNGKTRAKSNAQRPKPRKNKNKKK